MEDSGRPDMPDSEAGAGVTRFESLEEEDEPLTLLYT